jgi:putative ABC transport system permease protein
LVESLPKKSSMLNFLAATFRMGITNLRLHKLRSLLTALGIIFGVAAVIIMVAIGEGMKKSALDQIDRLGPRNILVRSIQPPESNDASNRSTRMLDYGIRRSDLELLKTMPGLEKVVPLRNTGQDIVRKDVRAVADAMGTTPEIFDVINLSLSRGTIFDWTQYDRREPVCVLGSLVAKQLFPAEDPVGHTILVGSQRSGIVTLTVVGVLEPTGLRAGSEGVAMMMHDLDADVFFPLTIAQETFGDTIVRQRAGTFDRRTIELSEVWLRANKLEEVEALSNIAMNAVGRAHSQLGDVDVKAPIQILRQAEHTSRIFSFILGGIAGFALVVGGIGIMNIMLATVTERTREIGIRRALGAKQKHITLQFLIETTVISLSGGFLGVVLGVGVAIVLPIGISYFTAASYPTSVTSFSVLSSFIISGLIGIGFGLYPAVKAARMDPIEALRHE